MIGCEKQKNLGLLTRYLTAIQPKTGIIKLGTIATIRIMIRIRIRINIRIGNRMSMRHLLRLRITQMRRPKKEKLCN